MWVNSKFLCPCTIKRDKGPCASSPSSFSSGCFQKSIWLLPSRAFSRKSTSRGCSCQNRTWLIDSVECGSTTSRKCPVGCEYMLHRYSTFHSPDSIKPLIDQSTAQERNRPRLSRAVGI